MNGQVRYRKLLQPGEIGALKLRNRIVMASMGTRLAGVLGEVNDATIAWYERRARGGVALVTVEATHVAAALFPVRGVIRMLRADDDCYLPGLSALAEVVHEAGAKVSIQLSIGRAGSTGSLWTPGLSGLQPVVGVGPSAVTFPDGTTPREMTTEEIRRTVGLFGEAAQRVKKAGFDAIELHAHFHSIPGCFLSPLYNKRTDEYGGNFENRLRFVREIIASMRQAVGKKFPLLVKYSIDEFVAGGRNIQDGLAIAKRLEEEGVDAIVVSQGQAGSSNVPYAPLYWPEGYMVPLAEALKKVVSIPVIVGGRLGDPDLAERVLEDGKADFVSMGRPLIADPDIPEKIRNGEVRTIRRCIADNWCFEIFGKAEMRCTLNPEAGRELKFAYLEPAKRKKKVVIVGAGPAGMEAARIAGFRGHRVVLYEQGKRLGEGELKLASIPPHKEILRSISDYYEETFKTIPNIKIKLGKKATTQMVLKEKPDVVVIATGGKSLVPDIPGIDGRNVFTAFDVLAGRVKPVGKTIAVCGGNAVGCETAHFLASRNNTVTIVEMLDRIGMDVESTSLMALRDELARLNVRIMTGAKAVGITDHSIIVSDLNGNRTEVASEMIVLAVGVEPSNELSTSLAGRVRELHVIGDAKKPGKIRDAVADGFILGFNL